MAIIAMAGRISYGFWGFNGFEAVVPHISTPPSAIAALQSLFTIRDSDHR
jgi:hypothetical protein